ncbi:MAG: hypothetical protein ACRDN9_20455, partial [Streptosporangiaceae bacterium]
GSEVGWVVGPPPPPPGSPPPGCPPPRGGLGDRGGMITLVVVCPLGRVLVTVVGDGAAELDGAEVDFAEPPELCVGAPWRSGPLTFVASAGLSGLPLLVGCWWSTAAAIVANAVATTRPEIPSRTPALRPAGGSLGGAVPVAAGDSGWLDSE